MASATTSVLPAADSALSFLAGGGRMGGLIRAFPWNDTPLGGPESWPAPLRTVVRIMLTTNHPVYIFWGNRHIGLYNDAYSRSLGAEKDPAILGMEGRTAWPEIWAIIGPQIEQVMSGGGATWHENQLVPIIRHGKLEDVYWTYSFGPIDDPTAPHGVGGVLVVCTETTAQVQSEHRLRAAEARWRSLFDQAPSFVCVLAGAQHRFEYANPRYLRLVGKERVVGDTVADVLPEIATQGFIEILDRVFATGESYSAAAAPVFLARSSEPDMERRFLDFVYQPVRNDAGAVVGIFVEGSDVTERVEAEAALRVSENRFRIMADGVPALIWVTDPAGNVEFVNREYCEFFGTTSNAIMEKGWKPLLHPDDAPAYVDAYQRARVGRATFQARARVAAGARGWRWIESRALPRIDERGKYLGHVGISPDVTDVVAAQQALADADRRKDEFLATLAHELRNPLAPIRNAAQIMRSASAEGGAREWAANVIDRQVRVMSELLDDLLDIARITRARLVLSKQRVTATSVINAAIETALPLIESRRHQLMVTIPSTDLAFDGDPLRLSQAISNLLTNAAKYTNPGGKIVVSASADSGWVHITVSDNGIGLEPSSLPRIFEMFGQVESALHRSQGGLGIGLALVRGIAELHGGRAKVHSAGLGMGAQFSLCIPMTQREISVPAAGLLQDDTQEERNRLTILIADDSADAADSLAEYLRMLGHDVHVAYSGPEALAAVRSLQPDAAILDIGMPGINGYDVSRAIRAEPWSSRIRLIAVSGWGQHKDKRDAHDAGFDAHLTKPIEPSQVESLLYESRHG